MNVYEYILAKQIQWALNHRIHLVGSKGNRGRPAYTEKLEDNLVQPLMPDVEKEFKSGDGGELTGNPSKMQAVHSSSALSVNIFQYWKKINQVSEIAYVCGFCGKTTKISKDIIFEGKYQIDKKFQHSPNIDVVIENDLASQHKVFAIECKFTEAYSNRKHSGLKEKYLKLDIWKDLPKLRNLAVSISSEDNHFHYLHPAQIIKHILALKKSFGKDGFRLLYLWYDAFGYEGAKHREEISEFIEVTKSDNICFHALSYHELIVKLADNFRDTHKEYIEYITSRYL
ncbi:MAG: hypothetical protein PHI44_01380 [Candidatus Ratteibacteria bacterium]|nr:hypothetical protein [Candidatus Ratteibacteria bacterium]